MNENAVLLKLYDQVSTLRSRTHRYYEMRTDHAGREFWRGHETAYSMVMELLRDNMRVYDPDKYSEYTDC